MHLANNDESSESVQEFHKEAGNGIILNIRVLKATSLISIIQFLKWNANTFYYLREINRKLCKTF